MSKALRLINWEIQDPSGALVISKPALELVPDPRVTPEQAARELELAQGFAVASPDRRLAAEEAMVRVKGLEERAHAQYDPDCDTAYSLWQEELGKRKAVLGPLEQARKSYGVAVAQWDADERRRREEEQQRLLAEERARADAERETTIELAEEAGASRAEVEALCGMPVVVAPVVAPSYASKSAVSTRPVIKGRINTDAQKLALIRHVAKEGNEDLIALLDVNVGKLNQKIASTNGVIKLPGVELYKEYVATTRGRR